jgi:hypothetical protein
LKEALLACDGEAGAVLRPVRTEGAAYEVLQSDPLMRARIWRADLTPRPGETLEDASPRWVVANVDCSESDLHRADEAWLRTVFGEDALYESDGGAREERTQASAGERAWWWLLLAALVALLAETALSQWFGSRAEARS